MKDRRVSRMALSFIFGEEDTVRSQVLFLEGEIKHLHLRVQDFTEAVTAALTLEDEDGYEIYNSTAKAKGATTTLTGSNWFPMAARPG